MGCRGRSEAPTGRGDGDPGPRGPATSKATDSPRPSADAAGGSAAKPTVELFKSLRVTGSHREIGRAMGKAFRSQIDQALAGQPAYARYVALAQGGLRERVAKLEQAARAHFPALVEELEGLSEGIERPFAELFAWNSRSEIDAAADPCPPGCSTVGLVSGGSMLLGHNEDGHAAYRKRMFLLDATPPSGVRFVALVYPGTLAGNGPGLNANAVAQTTNYIPPCDSSDGVPRYFVGRAVLEAKSLDEAVALCCRDPRAFPWHHNLADLRAGKLVSLETWPGRSDRRDVSGMHLHTNHLLHPKLLDAPENRSALDLSSRPRLARLEEIFAAGPPRGMADIVRALGDRAGEPCKLCRREGDPVSGVTVATALFESPKIEMRLLDGPMCDGPEQRVGL